jgi:hypothetical protein
VDDGESIAEEAVPFGRGGGCGGRRRHRGFGVQDLEVEGEVPRQRLRVAARVEEEAAVEAADLEVAGVEGAGAGAGEVREGPEAGGGGVTAALDGERHRGRGRWRWVNAGGRRGGGGSGGLHGLGIFCFVFLGCFSLFFLLGPGRQEARNKAWLGEATRNVTYVRCWCIVVLVAFSFIFTLFSVHFYYIQYSSRSTVLILVNPTFKSFGYLSIKYILFIFKLLLSMIFLIYV